MNVSTRPPEPPPSGKLDWLKLIAWLRDDGMIEPEEADKTIKIYREDDRATEETHPVDVKGFEAHQRAFKTF